MTTRKHWGDRRLESVPHPAPIVNHFTTIFFLRLLLKTNFGSKFIVNSKISPRFHIPRWFAPKILNWFGFTMHFILDRSQEKMYFKLSSNLSIRHVTLNIIISCVMHSYSYTRNSNRHSLETKSHWKILILILSNYHYSKSIIKVMLQQIFKWALETIDR